MLCLVRARRFRWWTTPSSHGFAHLLLLIKVQRLTMLYETGLGSPSLGPRVACACLSGKRQCATRAGESWHTGSSLHDTSALGSSPNSRVPQSSGVGDITIFVREVRFLEAGGCICPHSQAGG